MTEKAMRRLEASDGPSALALARAAVSDMAPETYPAAPAEPNDFWTGAECARARPCARHCTALADASDAAGYAPVFFRQPSAPILRVPAQAGYGDKWPS